MMTEEEKRQYMLQSQIAEMEDVTGTKVTNASANVDYITNVSRHYSEIQEAYLRRDKEKYFETDIETLPLYKDGIRLYQGDVNNLKCNALVEISPEVKTRQCGCNTPTKAVPMRLGSKSAAVRVKTTIRNTELKKQCDMAWDKPQEYVRMAALDHLPCDQVFYVYCPISLKASETENEAMWEACVHACLVMAETMGMGNIAFGKVDTGYYGLDAEKAFAIAVATCDNFREETGSKLCAVLPERG